MHASMMEGRVRAMPTVYILYPMHPKKSPLDESENFTWACVRLPSSCAEAFHVISRPHSFSCTLTISIACVESLSSRAPSMVFRPLPGLEADVRGIVLAPELFVTSDVESRLAVSSGNIISTAYARVGLFRHIASNRPQGCFGHTPYSTRPPRVFNFLSYG